MNFGAPVKVKLSQYRIDFVRVMALPSCKVFRENATMSREDLRGWKGIPSRPLSILGVRQMT